MTVYCIIFRKKATKEYLSAIAWHEHRSKQASLNFIKEVNQKLDILEIDLQDLDLLTINIESY